MAQLGSDSRGSSTLQLIEMSRDIAISLALRAAEYDRLACFPEANFALLRKEGFLALMVPLRAGGLGANFQTYTRVLTELAQGDAATALMFNMHNITIGTLAELELDRVPGKSGDTMRQFQDWVFSEVVDHRRLFASATSEPGIGAHLSRLRTTYRKTATGYALDGVKSFVSMAGHADYYVVAARSAGSREPAISFLVVEAANPGIRIEKTWDSMGMRSTASHTLYLEDCRIPRERLFLGSDGMALFKVAREPHWLAGGYNGVYLGISEAAFEFTVSHLAKKTNGRNRVVSADPLVQRHVGKMHCELEATRLQVQEAARLIDSQKGSQEANRAIHAAKYRVSEIGTWLTSQAIQLCGGSSLARNLPLERHYRDARCGGLMPATPDECLTYIGKSALGIDVSKSSETYW